MNGSRDQAMLGLALQNGLINREQALLVKERHQQFFQANRPVSVSAILRALKFVTDQELETLERAVDESGHRPAAANLPAGAARPGRPPTLPAASANNPAAVTMAAPARRAASPATGTGPAGGGGTVPRATTPGAGLPAGATGPTGAAGAMGAAAANAPTAIPPGAVKMLGKYKILQQIGHGGMGAVYLAEDTHLNRKVALKVLPKELAGNREFIKRFLAEARVTGKLSHPNIVVAYDIDSSHGLWFMAMEYLEGESIGARLKGGDRIGWRDALTMVKQVCKGLSYAHKAGIVHRDIKPDNLFLDKASGETKILDMGLSKNLHASENSSLTQAGMILGTPNYLAPEQAENGINVDGRADIYSLGTTLYHMLAGVPPFEGPTPLSIIQKHLFEPIPDIRKARPDLPVDVANILWKMTAKKPADRFADCAELQAAIDSVLDGRGFALSDPMQAQAAPRRGSGANRTTPGSGSGLRGAVRSGTRGTRGVAPIDRKSRAMYAQRGTHPVLFVIVGGLLLGAIGVLSWLAIRNNTPTVTALAGTTGQPLTTPGQPPITTGPSANPGDPATAPALAPAPGPNGGAAAPPGPAADLMALVGTASRGLNLSNDLDRELVDQEIAKQLMQETAPGRSSATPPPTGADASLSPRAGAARLEHRLSADEKKKAPALLDGFAGSVVFRMPVPPVTSTEVRDANILSAKSSELGDLNILILGAPPSQRNPEVYQSVFVEPDPAPQLHGFVTRSTRIRYMMKISANDTTPVEYRFMYSSLPVEGNTLLGGVMDTGAPGDWVLIDAPLLLIDRHVEEHNWFGYASGRPEDFKAKRQITVSVSDVVIYNPKD